MRANSYLFAILLLTCVAVDSKSHNKKVTKGKLTHLSQQQLEVPEENALLQKTEQHELEEKTQLLETKKTSNTTSLDDVDLGSIDPDNAPTDERLGENDDEEYLVKYLMFALLWMLILHIGRKYVEERMGSFLIPANHAIYRDLTILTFILCVSVVLHYEEIFEDVGVNWKEFHLGFALFIVIWLLMGIGFIVAIHIIGTKWQMQEEKCRDLKKLSEENDKCSMEAENLQEQTQAKRKEIQETQDAFQYAVMRHSFIYNKYLPTAQESVLRNDFDFSLYLCKCLGLLVASLFQLNLFSYILIGVSLGIWWALRQLDDEDQALIILFVPAYIMIAVIFAKYKLQSILSQLVEFSGDRKKYKLYQDNSSLQREVNQYSEEIPIPQYLNLAEQKNNRSFGSFILGKHPNRHEILFPFDAVGPVLFTFFIQAFVVISSLWFVTMCTIHIDDVYGKCGDVGATLLLFLVFGCWIASLVYFIPQILKLMNITTCIGMLRKDRIVDEVSFDQSSQRTKMFFKFYRKIKQYRQKQIKDERGKKSMPQIQKFVEEAYTLLGAENSQLPASKLPELGKLCGVKLDQNQIRILEQSCSDDKKMIHIMKFLQQVEQFTYDIILGPRQTINWVLHHFLSQKLGKDNEFIQPNDIKELLTFLDEKNDFFTDEEKELFTKYLVDLKTENEKIYINDIANLVANDLDHMRW